MAIFVRRVVKGMLFVGLFILSMKFVHTYPVPMTNDQVEWWFVFSEKFGIGDVEGFWLSVTALADLIVTIFLYLGVLKLWKNLQMRHRTVHPD
jgi:hypothetical protein